MGVDYRHGISIFELIVYFPCTFLSLYVVFKHGFRRTSGWIFLFLFSSLRIVGAVCSLVAMKNPSKGAIMGWAICTSIGLSPLMMVCLGLLSRVNDALKRESGKGVQPLLFHLLHMSTMVGAILSAVGTSSSAKGQGGGMASLTQSNTKTKVGTILYLVSWTLLTLLFLYFASKKTSTPSGEGRLVVAVGFSIPLILVRIIYSLIWSFTNDMRFNMLQGNVTTNLVMAVLEEMAVTIACLAVGVTLQKAVSHSALHDTESQTQMDTQYKPVHGIEQSPPPQESYSYKPQRNRIGGNGLIGTVVRLGVDAIQSRQEQRGRR